MAEELSQHIQDCFVLLAITDKKFLSLARPVIKPEYFSSSVTEQIIKLCYSFYDQFKEPPKDHLHDELKRFFERKPNEEKEFYTTYLEKLNTLSVTNKDYVLSRIGDFVKTREFEASAIKFVELVEKSKFNEAKDIMYSTLKNDFRPEQAGLDYTKQFPPTYYKDLDEDEFLIPTGIPHLDRLIGGYKRGKFICFLGGMKGSKSWACIHTAKQGLIKGLKILHLTHEMSAEEVEQRYDMSLGGLVSTRQPADVRLTYRDETGVIDTRRTETRKVDTVYNLRKTKKVRTTIKRFGGRLLIVKYPMGTCSMADITRYLDHAETFDDFIPDIIINDYIDIMKLPLGDSASLRDRLNRSYIEHKQLADERNILIVTVSQTNKEGRRKRKGSHKDIAEDIRKLANVDMLISLAQTDEMKEEQIMQVWIVGARSGRDECGCLISQNLEIGQFCIQSWFPPSNVHVDDESDDD
jgi:replicative DNA helicase